jgi:hypothetical protein
LGGVGANRWPTAFLPAVRRSSHAQEILPMHEDSNVAVILAFIIVMTATIALLQISGTIHLPGL